MAQPQDGVTFMALTDALQALRSSPSLRPARPQTLERLAAGMKPRQFSPGSVIFWQGDASDDPYLVQAGHVWLTSNRPDGADQFVSDLGPGSLVGDYSALRRSPRAVTATAHTRVDAWEIDIDELDAVLLADHALCYAMLMEAIGLVLEKNFQAVVRAGMSTRQKLASVLLEIVERYDSDDLVVRLGHNELAMMIGVTRESVTRAMSSLRADGLVERRGRAIVVVDPNGLHGIAGV